jgi:carbohydrate binding protein with CBM6 domain/type IX secretion system substrate protein/SprB-like repeat protein
MKKNFLHLIVFFGIFCFANEAQAQSVRLELAGQKDCADLTYCATIQVQAGAGENLRLGTSSILMTYDDRALSFKNYTPLNFDGSALCAGGATLAWTPQQYDAVSKPGEFDLTLTLADNGNSCPTITDLAPIEVGTVCFDILQQGASPGMAFDMAHTQFNRDIPDDGTNPLPVSSVDSIFEQSLLACDCPGEGAPCDDNNVYTINDQYDLNCHCQGEYLDTDQDGILDGIDACIDQNYEAEDAEISGPAIKNNFPQYSGLSFVDYAHNSGDYIEFTVNAAEEGNHTLSFRYALEAGSRPLELSIDGAVVVASLDFPATGNWAVWDTVSTEYFFLPGTHTVRLTSIGSNGGNIDLLILSFCTGCTESGLPCDDGDPCTADDVVDANCNCGGKYEDTDQDGICNTEDVCEGSDDSLDSDGDGTPDGCDTCDNILIGTACDDGDPCTEGDVYDGDCNCAGTFTGADSDNDGICDTYDICPGNDDNLDSDNDGVPDGCDPCDNSLVGRPCDDGNPCTVLDVYAYDCSCVGITLDSDEDGVCDALDQCPGHDDNLDNDNDGVPDFCDPNLALTGFMEVGFVPNVGEAWQTVTLTNTYPSMVVIATVVLPNHDMPPVVTRISNAGGKSFDLRVQNPGDTTSATYPVQYFVVEEGVYTAAEHGLTMEAQRAASALTAGNFTSWGNREVRTYANSYQYPVVIGQVMTQNDERWSSFWSSRGNSSSTPPDSLSFAAGKHIGQDTITDRADETIGIVVVETGVGLFNGFKLESAVGPDIVEGTAGTVGGYKYTLNLERATLAMLSSTGMDGGDGAWPVLMGEQPIAGTTMALAVDEDQIFDTERYHTTEEVAYLAFEFNYPLSLTASATDASCNGGSDGTATTSVGGGYAPYSYLWSNGATGKDVNGLAAGSFTVTVTDEIGTELVATVEAGQPPAIENVITAADVSCFGGGDGAASVASSGGTGTLTFAWSNGETTATITGLGAGTYTVTATDENGCSTSSSVMVGQPNLLTLSTVADPVNCFAGNDGAASVTYSGGAGNPTYQWNTGDTDASISGLVAGNYTVTATDANGCTATDAIEVTEPEPLTAGVAGADITCFGEEDGEISTTHTGGTGDITYLWNNGATTPAITNLPAGTYTATLTDANGCTVTTSYDIVEPAVLTSTVAATDVSCFGKEDGEAAATSTGGTGGVTFLWDNGETTQTVSQLGPGSYTVVSTDANGCTASATAIVAEPDSLFTTVTGDDVSCFGGNDGSATASAGGGTGAIVYIWSNGATGPMAVNLSAGTFEVTATDENGCTSTSDVTIGEAGALSVVVDEVLAEVGSNMEGAISITVSGGAGPPYTFKWYLDGLLFSEEEDLTGLAAGEYVLHALDANGCLTDDTVVVENLTALSENELAENIKLMPNPTSGKILLKIDLPEVADITVSIYDLTGRQIAPEFMATLAQQDFTFDLSEQPAGVYILKMVIGNQVLAKKIVVSR